MFGRGIIQQGLRPLGCLTKSATRRTILSQKNIAKPAAISALRQTRCIQTERHFQTERLTPAAGQEILVAQRKKRPISPHLAIYRLQINYFTSPVHRITGCLLSGPLYIFGISYLVAPLFGLHLDSASIAAAFGSLPVGVKIAAKFAMAWPLAFHCINGVGHLIWDTGRRFSTKAIVTQGWTVVGLSLVGAGYLATMV